MTARLQLSNNWDQCPVPWRNFAKAIHSDKKAIPESIFWLLVKHRLRIDFNAQIVEDPTLPRRMSHIEFNSDKDLTWFLLRWS